MSDKLKPNKTDFIKQNKIFWLIAAGTLLLLLIPFMLMTFRVPLLDPGSGYEVLNWNMFDFMVMGLLIFGTASAFVLVARKIDRKYRLGLGLLLIALFVWIWAELAVGVFTNWGS